MTKKQIHIVVFVLSSLCLIMSMELFINLAIYADEHGTSPSAVCGGDFANMMDWLRMFFLALISLLSAVGIFKDK